METAKLRDGKISELAAKIAEEEREIARLRSDVSDRSLSQPKKTEENQPEEEDDSLASLDKEGLKNQFYELKCQLETECRVRAGELEDLKSRVASAREVIKELERVCSELFICTVGKEDKRAQTAGGVAADKRRQREEAGECHVAAQGERGRVEEAGTGLEAGEDAAPLQSDQAQTAR